jgi:catechol 2,3-dioxygenase-like lactoylglutathione lyase family enzyme
MDRDTRMNAVMGRTAALVLAMLTLQGPPAGAAPMGAGPRAVAQLRRTALVVHDIDAALALYRDALGMQVVSDHTNRSPADAKTDAEAKSVLRLVLLRGNDDYLGQLELLYYAKPQRNPRPARTNGQRAPGDVVMLFATADVAAVFAKARAVPGVRTDGEPRSVPVHAPDGKAMTTQLYGYLYDPDGNYVEISQSTDPHAP